MTDDAFPLRAIGEPVEPGDVVFLLQAGYHLDDAVATAEELDAAGVGTSFVAPRPPEDALRRLRSSWARARELDVRAAQAGLHLGGSTTEHDVLRGASALVVRNDWGPSRSFVQRARADGVPVVGWVEGAQDFHDVDTGRTREPYATVDRVFALGDYDAEVLADRCRVDVVGSERLWSRWHGPVTTAEIQLLANVNFTYAVGGGARARWVGDAIAAARAAGRDLRVTRHPADRGLRGRTRQMPGGTDELLPRAARLITRFSTAVYDALALGVAVAYHNPHGERVPNFAEPDGAFERTSSRSELTDWIRGETREPESLRAAARGFLTHHVRLEGERPGRRAAALLRELRR